MLGYTLDDDAKKDAIHIAIIPVIAGEENLSPGQHVGLIGKNIIGKSNKSIGIIDPFITEPIYKNSKVYLCMYPETITNLRHDWEHPAFIDLDEAKQKIEEMAKICGKDYDTLMDEASDYNKYGDYIYDNSERYKKIDWKEFWKYFEAITGDKVKDNWAPYTCSC